jgi:hypothetical protein
MEEGGQCKETETLRKQGDVLRKIKRGKGLVFVDLESTLYLKNEHSLLLCVQITYCFIRFCMLCVNALSSSV